MLHFTANGGLIEIHSGRSYARNANGNLKGCAWEYWKMQVLLDKNSNRLLSVKPVRSALPE